jgi:hypothetical protein
MPRSEEGQSFAFGSSTFRLRRPGVWILVAENLAKLAAHSRHVKSNRAAAANATEVQENSPRRGRSQKRFHLADSAF